MIELFKPDMYVKDIYSIDYEKLKSYGIKCILFDLDNTLVPCFKKKPTRKLKDFIERIKDKGFKVIIFSNSKKKRLQPFKNVLEVDCSYSSKKPFQKKFKKVLKEYSFSQSEVAMVGDQLLTDIYGGNRLGIFTVLVTPINKKEFVFTKFNRVLEKRIIRKLERKNIFRKGEYYE